MNVREEYVIEQSKKRVREYCYGIAKAVWDGVKGVYGREGGSDAYPYITAAVGQDTVDFQFSCGTEEDVEDLLEGRVNGQEIVVLPIQLQELYYREPRYSDEYVRYQIGRVLEDYINNKSTETTPVNI